MAFQQGLAAPGAALSTAEAIVEREQVISPPKPRPSARSSVSSNAVSEWGLDLTSKLLKLTSLLRGSQRIPCT